MRFFGMFGVVAALTLLLTGCQQTNHKEAPRKPVVFGQKKENLSTYAQTVLENSTQPKTPDARIRKMELKAQQEIERIRAEKELEIARLQAEREKMRAESEKETALKKIQAQLEEIVGERKLKGWVVFLSALFLFLLLWVVVKLVREYHRHRAKLEEECRRHEKEMQERELQARLAEKMFDALASGHLDKEQQNRLLDAVAGPDRQLPLKKP